MAAVHAVRQQLVAALIAVARIADRIRHRACGIPVLHGGGDRFRLGPFYGVGPHHGNRRGLAAAHAGDRLNPDPVRVGQHAKLVDQPGRAEHLTGQRFTYPHGQRRGCVLIGLQNVEMVIESGCFINFGHGQLHFNSQGQEMAVRQVAVVVLEPVQVFHQQVAGTRRVSQEFPYLGQRLMGRNTALDAAFLAARAFHYSVLSKWEIIRLRLIYYYQLTIRLNAR